MWYGLPLSFHQPLQTPTAHLSQPCVSFSNFSRYNLGPVHNKARHTGIGRADVEYPTNIIIIFIEQ